MWCGQGQEVICVKLPNSFCPDTINPPLMEWKGEHAPWNNGVSQAGTGSLRLERGHRISPSPLVVRLEPSEPPERQDLWGPCRRWILMALSTLVVSQTEGRGGTLGNNLPVLMWTLNSTTYKAKKEALNLTFDFKIQTLLKYNQMI